MKSLWKMPVRVAVLTVLLSACATYVPPADGAPSAELTLQLGDGTTILSVVKDSVCSNGLTAPQIAQQGQLWDNTKTPVRIVADKRIFLYASTLTERAICSNISSFVPLADHKYGLRQTMSPRSCQIHIVDLATNKPPETLIAHPACL